MLGWLKRRVKLEEMNSGLASAFIKIKEDIYSQKRAIEEIYEHHHTLKNNSSLNHQRIADWIKHFDNSIKKLDNDTKSFEKRLSQEFDKIGNASLKLFKDAYSKNIKDAQALKKEILSEVEVFIKNERQKDKDNVDNVNNVKLITPEASYDSLTNPEKWLAGVLFNSENPLSYSQIAQRTGKTISTVRVYMNQLKMKGFIDESTLPNGIKIFSLRHKAKVKKLYNL